MINETKNKHMTLDDRIEIQECLSKGMSFKAIAARIGKTQLLKKSRTYDEFLCFVEQNDNAPLVQLDTVIGRVGFCLQITVVNSALFPHYERNIDIFGRSNVWRFSCVFNVLFACRKNKTFLNVLPKKYL